MSFHVTGLEYLVIPCRFGATPCISVLTVRTALRLRKIQCRFGATPCDSLLTVRTALRPRKIRCRFGLNFSANSAHSLATSQIQCRFGATPCISVTTTAPCTSCVSKESARGKMRVKNESGDRAVGVVPAKRPHRARQTHKTTASRTSSTPNDRAVFPEEPLLMVLCVYKSSARRAVRTPMGGTAPRGVPASPGPGEPPLVIP